MSFERARQPEQIAHRRASIIDATLTLFRAGGFDDTRLEDIGRLAGVSKATVYRYFESKEAIFLELLGRETEAWVDEMERVLGAARRPHTVDEIAAAVADSLAGRPDLGSLAARLSSVLERNVSEDAIRRFKRENMALTVRLVNALHAASPALSVEAAHRFIAIVVTFQNGLFPTTHPPPAARAVLAEPEFASYRSDYRDALFDAARLLLVALTLDR
jgi:TetR/AcrR family transcriptional regulator